MKATKITTPLTTFVLLAATGCLGHDPARAGAAPLTEGCSGTYVCEDADGSFERYEVSFDDGDCEVGPYYLYEDGSVSDYTTDYDDVAGLDHWEGNTAIFTICDDESSRCLTCADATPPTTPSPADDAPAEEPASEGHCGGSASSCYGRGSGSCSSIDGCYQTTHVRWNGDLEFVCEGVPKRCESYETSRSCRNQSGCYWYD